MEINIDFRRIRSVADVGIHRAAAFMGFGLNAAGDQTLNDFGLVKSAHIELIPKVAEPQVEAYKTAFARWIVLSGLRDAIEAFAIFMDGIHDACSLIAYVYGDLESETATKRHRSFTFDGLPGKLKRLDSEFGVTCPDADVLASIHQCRNCMTHRGGRIGVEDCSDSETLEVTWPGVEIALKAQAGETVLQFPLERPFVVNEETRVCVRMVRRTVSYKPGDTISFSPTDTAEICWFLMKSINELTRSAEGFAQSMGVPQSGT